MLLRSMVFLSIDNLLHKYSMELVDLKESKVHGGTICFVAARKKKYKIESIIDRYNISIFSHDRAVINLSFSGNLNQLKVAFKQSDLEFNLKSKQLNLVK